ncbi:P-loop containing nucleoside triphosphate hydrolase protein [Zopfochytrium polystomum]|nr:P-loop containing nucleoside triphosphate hydrolase protein [Zopfochytrium polystomum]
MSTTTTKETKEATPLAIIFRGDVDGDGDGAAALLLSPPPPPASAQPTTTLDVHNDDDGDCVHQQLSWNPISFATVGWLTPVLGGVNRKVGAARETCDAKTKRDHLDVVEAGVRDSESSTNAMAGSNGKQSSSETFSEKDIPRLRNQERASTSAQWLDAFFKQAARYRVSVRTDSAKARPPSLLWALLPHVAVNLAAIGVYQSIAVTLSICQSLMIAQIVNYLDPTYDRSQLFLQTGYGLAFLMSGMVLLYAVFGNLSETTTHVAQIRLRAALVGSIYKKSLYLSPRARKDFPAGKINSFIGSDVDSVNVFFGVANTVWTLPIQVGVSLFLVAQYLKVSTVVAAGTFLVLMIPSLIIFPRMIAVTTSARKFLDERTSRLREFLYGVKLAKYQAIEDHFEDKILQARERQLKFVVKQAVLFSGILVSNAVQNQLIPALTLITFGALGNSMKADVVFTALSLIMSLVASGSNVSFLVQFISSALVSYKRLQEFFLAPEAEVDEVVTRIAATAPADCERTDDVAYAIHLEHASFTWESSNDSNGASDSSKSTDSPNNDKFELHDLNMKIPVGSLVAVVGATGSGKSSLLAALASVMRRTNATPSSPGEGTASTVATIRGSVAYCAQEPWIVSGTILENIALGIENSENKIWDEASVPDRPWIQKCKAAVKACAIDKDLMSFDDGLFTQIGEKGVNLSGGQKARIALARAMVLDSDIYLLDDPLSSLDAHVANAVFHGAVRGPLLRSKTVVLATHLLQYLPFADYVVVVDNGRIVEQGSFKNLMCAGGQLKGMMNNYGFDGNFDQDDGGEEGNKKPGDTSTEEDGQTVLEGLERSSQDHKSKGGDARDLQHEKSKAKKVAEDRETGAVKFRIYVIFFTAVGLHWLLFFMLLIATNVTMQVLAQVILSKWTADTSNVDGFGTYLYPYMGLSLGGTIFSGITLFMCMYLAIRAGRYLHKVALSGLLHAPMSFFDVQPVGRILNRMTNDLNAVDWNVGMFLAHTFNMLSTLLVLIIFISISSPYIIVLFVLIIIVGLLIFNFFITAYRELKRLSATMMSPLASHVSETLTGIPTIIGDNLHGIFIGRQIVLMDKANLASLIFDHAQLWFTFRLDTMGSLVVLVVCLLGVTGVLSTTFVGLALTMSISFSSSLNNFLLTFGKVEAAMASTERLVHYMENLPREADWHVPKDDALDKDWPKTGRVAVRDLEICYEMRSDAMVIKGVSFDIQPGEKIAVVGRTGSGKSTLMDAFFRIVEASAGTISIDGQDIATVGLRRLRRAVQMIPQNPILFDGTVRSNLDVQSKHTDAEIWKSLEMTGMKDFVNGLEKKLDSAVSEGGANFSAGQRQLLCLARALLARTTILIMDEATSSVDVESDRRLQELVHTLLRETTVISVAHRLNTIAAYDRVIVLDGGRIVEMDSPHALLGRDSTFSQLVESTGSANAAAIRDVARERLVEKSKPTSETE